MNEIQKNIKSVVINLPKEDAITKSVQCFEVSNLYEDNTENIETTTDILYNINKWSVECNDTITYAYIKHDKDVYLENTFNEYNQLIGIIGDVKKSHYHLYVMLPYSMKICDIATKLNVKQNRIRGFQKKHFTNKVLYLTHICHPNKYQYDINEIRTNKREYVKYIYEQYKPIETPIMFLIRLISTTFKHSNITYKTFISLMFENDIDYNKQLKEFSICKEIINEHNKQFTNDKLSNQLDMVRLKNKEIIKEFNELKNKEKLLECFGCYQDDNGTIYAKFKNENKKGIKL